MLAFLVLILAVLSSSADDPEDRDRVVGGKPAKPGQFPYIVSLQHTYNRNHFCGAGIITNRWLLTAAHCIEWKHIEDFVVFGGSIYLNETEAGVYYTVEKKKVFPNDQSSRLSNDVGMLKVSKNIVFNPDFQPIKLPYGIDVKCKDEAIALGWGDTSYPGGDTPNQLQYLVSRIVDTQKCSILMDFTLDDGHLCFGGDSQFGLCHGDSGSPLVYVANNESHVVGIVSWGEPCAAGFPDVFAKVSHYLTWIEDTIRLD